ncbi:MAG TPA: MBL fold metallo-hydrolase [Vicinamibacterales bacterium]|nr:MBL fold metallo-hydrolase [Vicinamibacterales bacterium]
MRRRLVLIIILIAIGALSTGVMHAQQDVIGIRLEKVKDNLYLITGGRATPTQGGISGVTTVFLAATDVVVIDTKYPGFGNRILEQIKTVTSKPVTMIVNTHTHGDHTGSNGEFPRTVQVVAQENTKTNMTRMEAFKGDGAAFLPKRTFADRLSLFGGNDRMELYYFGRGHTNGDTVIVFPALRTAVMGDLFARKWAPLVDANNGGSAIEYPQTLGKVLATIKDVDTVVTGHSTTQVGSGANVTSVRSNPVMKWTDLQEYQQFTRAFVDAASAAQKAGKSADQAAGSLGLPDKYRSYDMANAKADVQRVYDELASAAR